MDKVEYIPATHAFAPSRAFAEWLSEIGLLGLVFVVVVGLCGLSFRNGGDVDIVPAEYSGPMKQVVVAERSLQACARICSSQDPEHRSPSYWYEVLVKYNPTVGYWSKGSHLVVPSFFQFPHRYLVSR